MTQDQEVKYAGFGIRFLAAILDSLFMIPIAILIFYVMGIDLAKLTTMDPNATFGMSDAVLYAISIIYLTYFLAKKGQATPGKAVLNLYVGNRDGSQLSGTKSFLRALGSCLTAATLGLGFLPVLFTKEKVSLHDWLCNTRVFRR